MLPLPGQSEPTNPTTPRSPTTTDTRHRLAGPITVNAALSTPATQRQAPQCHGRGAGA